MKAKEYIAVINTMRREKQPDAVIAADLIKRLMQEGHALGLQRSGGRFNVSDRVVLAILKEQDLKYRAIAYEVGFNPNGWKDLWKDKEVEW